MRINKVLSTVFDDKARKVKSPTQHVPTPSETGRMYFLLRCLKLKLAEAQSSLFLVEKDPGAGPGSQARAYPVVDFRQARSQYPILSYWEVLTVPS